MKTQWMSPKPPDTSEGEGYMVRRLIVLVIGLAASLPLLLIGVLEQSFAKDDDKQNTTPVLGNIGFMKTHQENSERDFPCATPS